jgi:hypothetical protein
MTSWICLQATSLETTYVKVRVALTRNMWYDGNAMTIRYRQHDMGLVPRSLDSIYSHDMPRFRHVIRRTGHFCYLVNEKNDDKCNKKAVMGSSLVQQKQWSRKVCRSLAARLRHCRGVRKGGGGCRAAAPPQNNSPKPKIKKGRFCRYYHIQSFTWVPLQPKSAAEVSWWLVR